MVTAFRCILMPELNTFSDDTPESLERRSGELLASSEADNVPRPTTVTYTEHDDPFSLIGDSSGSPHIALLSPNAWVACGNDIYVLDLVGWGRIRVERVEPIGSVEGVHIYPAVSNVYCSLLKHRCCFLCSFYSNNFWQEFAPAKYASSFCCNTK